MQCDGITESAQAYDQRRKLMNRLSREERNCLVWLDSGAPPPTRDVPPRLIKRGLVEIIDGEAGLTWAGAVLAQSFRTSDENAGRAA